MVDCVKITDIIVPKYRQRKEIDMEPLEDLADSIASNGLFNPIAVAVLADGKYQLVAGERRLNAIKLLHNRKIVVKIGPFTVNPEHIPVLFLRDLNEYDLIEIELHENIKREDISWKERAEAERKLHKLRTAQDESHTLYDTAKELLKPGAVHDTIKTTATRIKQDIALTEAMEKNPDAFKKAKSKKDAIKVLANQQANNLFSQLAAKQKESTEDYDHTVIHANVLDWAYDSQDAFGSYDCILVDPPYGIDANNFGEQATTSHNYSDTKKYFESLMKEFIPLSFALASDMAHMYLFHDHRNAEYLRELCEDAGWTVWHAPLIWVKNNGMLPSPEYAPRRTYESILFCNKYQMPVTGVYNDTLVHPVVQDKLHAAQKPVSLYTDLLRRSCREGYKVLDAFAGSGTILPAANELGLIATAIEASEENYNKCISRLNEGK